MNNKGQLGILLGIMFFAMVLIIAIITYPVNKQLLTTAIDPDHLDCDNLTISPSVLATCLTVDLIPAFYFITVVIVGLGSLAIGSRIQGG